MTDNKLLVWDTTRSAYKLTEAGNDAIVRIEDAIHRHKQEDLLRKLRGKVSSGDKPRRDLESDEEVAPHLVRLFFNLVADAKSVRSTLGEVKQNLECGGVTLEENLNKVLYCIRVSNEIGRLYSRLCGLFEGNLETSKNQQKVLLEAVMGENEEEFSSVAELSEKMVLSCLPGGDFAGKLLCILYVVSCRQSSPVSPRPRPQACKGIKDVMDRYVNQRANDLVERLERDPSVAAFVQEQYAEHTSLKFLFDFKLKGHEVAWPTEAGTTTHSVGQVIYHSVMDATVELSRKGQGALPALVWSHVKVCGGEEGDQDMKVLLPENGSEGPPEGADGDFDDGLKLLKAGLDMSGVRARQPLKVDEVVVATALGNAVDATSGGEWVKPRPGLLSLASVFVQGLKNFSNGVNVAVLGFPHSTSMKDLFVLHSKSMHLSESAETVAKTIQNLAQAQEIVLDEGKGTKAFVDRRTVSLEDATRDIKSVRKALMLVIAKLSDLLMGEIKTAAENLFTRREESNQDLFENVDLICKTMLKPIFETLQVAHPVTRAKFSLHGVVAVIHGVLMALKKDKKTPDGSQRLAAGLKKSLDLIDSCMDDGPGSPRLTDMVQGDSNYHLYESSVMRSQLVLKVLNDSPEALDARGLLPDIEEWSLRK
ncbi:hypothetical protein HOP50_05g36210 [Chloropicon primus]|nr:hypothetical protein HOP50_05g36210 [Chloropicon primus]